MGIAPGLASLTAWIGRGETRDDGPDAVVKRYDFRAMKPLFDTAAFSTCGLPDAAEGSAKLWTRDAAGAVNMQATATYA